MSAIREQLLGYLLGALEPAEIAEIELALRNNPQLQREMERLEKHLAPLDFPNREDEIAMDGPPPGLAERTCEFIDECRSDVVPRSPAPVARIERYEGAGEHSRRARWPDIIVATTVALGFAALIFPAIITSRQSAQVTACQDNLRNLGMALSFEAGRSPHHRIPAVPMRGNRAAAGIYAPMLHDVGHLADSQLIICPSSELGKQVGEFHLPTLAELDLATGQALARIQKTMGGSYAYNLGYMDDGEVKAPRWENRSHYAVMGDAPSTFRPERRSKNHGGRGQNLLYEDSRVKFVMTISDELIDDPYLNRSGLVAAGEDCTDVVLGESIAKPMPSVFMPPMR